MIKIRFDTRGNIKQKEAAKIWATDSEVSEILYGGSKGSGKSYLGCALVVGDALLYPGTKYFIARSELNDLRRFTIPSLLEVLEDFGVGQDYYNYNGQDNHFTFYNGSMIYLLSAKYMPSDPLFHRFGSMQFTRGWIEEAGEIKADAKTNLVIAVGRWKNKKYELSPKTLITCNPSKNFLYKEFYLPHKQGTLDSHRAFIQALPEDNKALGKEYIEHLRKNLRGAERERLLFGNWEYDSNPNALLQYDNIIALFDNEHVKEGKKYITADVARFGADKAVIMVWDGFRVVEVLAFEKSKTTLLKVAIEVRMNKYDIPVNQVIVDEDGVGGGLVDELNCEGFTNNAKPINQKSKDKKYKNLQQQCIFEMCRMIERKEIYISPTIKETYKESIIEELEQIKMVSDAPKLTTVSKKDIKAVIGRSPDFRDALMMRMYFEIKKNRGEVGFVIKTVSAY